MQIVSSMREMSSMSDELRKGGRTIVLVPTMGYFHEGHLSLMREGRRRGDVLVVSLFVNPTQFGEGEDYQIYPRDFSRDKALVEGIGVNILFVPTVEQMYPEGYQTFVEAERVTKPMEGQFRPIHFRGVTTVVAKLFNIVKPHMAIFGEKDFQQLAVIRRMVEDLNMGVEIIGMPIVRERDGLAMSSRNPVFDFRSAESRPEPQPVPPEGLPALPLRGTESRKNYRRRNESDRIRRRYNHRIR